MTNLFDAAKAIMQLQVLCGIIPVIKGKGENAKVVADMLIKLREEVGREDEVVDSELTIDELILVDRELDLVTPMLTPLSYEGLIDEIFGIQHGFAALPSELVPGAGNQWNQRDNEQARVKVTQKLSLLPPSLLPSLTHSPWLPLSPPPNSLLRVPLGLSVLSGRTLCQTSRSPSQQDTENHH